MLGSENHYNNAPKQYTVIFHGCKNDNFQVKNCDIFPTINALEQKSENNVYPCKPQFYYIKVGCKGSTLHRHVCMMWDQIQLEEHQHKKMKQNPK